MKSIEFTRNLSALNKKILSVADLAKLLNSTNRNTLYKTAGRLVKKGVIRKLGKGLYVNVARPPDKYEIANNLYSPSYVSLESALHRYGVIAQAPYIITSVTPRKTQRKSAEGSDFEYVHMAPKYFCGYYSDSGILIAEREKALLDLLYLISKKSRRFNLEGINFREFDWKRFRVLLKAYRFLPLINLVSKLNL